MAKKIEVTAQTRIGSMVLDHFAMTCIAMIFFIPGMISSLSTIFDVSHEPGGFDLFGEMSYVGLIGFAIYFCKDSFNGRSIAKRVLKLQVVENKSGKGASPIRCFVRNIFCILWPIEVFVAFANPRRRIGDMVAGTKVVPYNPEGVQAKNNYLQIGLSFVLAYGLLVLLPFDAIGSQFGMNRIDYVKSSINEQAARETEQLLTEELGIYLTADVRVYDEIEGNADLKYVSAILRLKGNYLNPNENFEHIRSTSMGIIRSKFPQGTVVGKIKFVYEEPGSLRIQSFSLD